MHPGALCSQNRTPFFEDVIEHKGVFNLAYRLLPFPANGVKQAEETMVLAKITGAGLSSIAMLVIVLWACILGERLIVDHANREFSGAMAEIRQLQMKRRAEPASVPTPIHRTHPAIG